MEQQETSKTDEGLKVSEMSQGRPDDAVELLESSLKDLKVELEAERKKNTEQANKIKYLQADILNLQKQSDRMIAEARNQSKLTWVIEIIAIQEDLQRAITVGHDDKSKALVSGLKMMLSRIENLLVAEDVHAIDVKTGQNFDPRFHEAISFVESNKNEEGKIISVIGKGYTMGGKVIKPALVEVSRKGKPEESHAKDSSSLIVNEGT